jgi:hypothetical protein
MPYLLVSRCMNITGSYIGIQSIQLHCLCVSSQNVQRMLNDTNALVVSCPCPRAILFYGFLF